jgi:hypothetical protein
MAGGFLHLLVCLAQTQGRVESVSSHPSEVMSCDRVALDCVMLAYIVVFHY